MRSSLFLGFASLSILAAVACSAPASDDEGSIADDLTGSLSDATACAVEKAYAAASLEDIAPLTLDQLPTSVRAKVPADAITYGKLRFGTRDAYVVEVASELRFYENRGLQLARAEKRGADLAWSGPTGASLSCNGAPAPAIDAGTEGGTEAGPIQACITKTKIDATQFPYAPARPAAPGSCTADEAKAIGAFYSRNIGSPGFTVAMWKGSVTPRCAECAFGVDISSTVDADERWAPIMLTANRGVKTNKAGCMEQVSGSEQCGRAFEQLEECMDAACRFTCTTDADYAACKRDPSMFGSICADAVTTVRGSCPADLTGTETKCSVGPYTFDEPVRRACVAP